MKKNFYYSVRLFLFFWLVVLSPESPSLFLRGASAVSEDALRIAEQGVSAAQIVEHVKILASDSFGGRFPASTGEELTARYLEQQFKLLGLHPGNRDSYFQEVPLTEVAYDRRMELTITGDAGDQRFYFGRDFVAVSPRMAEKISIARAPIVFAGYGIHAPEHQWDDYQGLDVRGKIVMVLLNEPGYDDPQSPLFRGDELTQYGRADYKYEEARLRGAAGVLIIHQEKSAGYPWESERFSKPRPRFFFDDRAGNQKELQFQGWISFPAAQAIFTASRRSLPEIRQQAGKPGFKGFPLKLGASLAFQNSFRSILTRNIMAVCPGGDRADEIVVFIAHWDHLGVDESLPGEDKIYNGAADNAVGVAALLELARAFRSLPQPLRRSILFLMPTCEERGLLGSRYYTENPVFPLNKTVAAFNIDGVSLVGRMKDVTIIGFGLSELDHYVAREAQAEGRYVSPDRHLDQGYFYRLDHYNFARAGVPAIHVGMGSESVLYGREWTEQRRAKDISSHYHQVTDEYNPKTWDLSGCVDDLRLLFRVACRLASGDVFPAWNEGVIYKNIRQSKK